MNIGNPKSIPLMNVVKLIEKRFNKNVKNYLSLQTGDIIKTEANIKNEQKIYNLKFKVNINQGIDKFFDWFFHEK